MTVASALTTPAQIDRLRIATLRAMLRLEILGLRRSSSPSAYVILKRELHIRGTRDSILSQVNTLLAKPHTELESPNHA